jgi:hypothetical protein
LLQNLRHVHAGGSEEDYLVPDDALKAFMERCANQIGEQYFKTPRQTVKQFVQLLSILDQNPELDWQEVIGEVEVEEETNPDLQPVDGEGGAEDAADERDGDDLASFEL